MTSAAAHPYQAAGHRSNVQLQVQAEDQLFAEIQNGRQPSTSPTNSVPRDRVWQMLRRARTRAGIHHPDPVVDSDAIPCTPPKAPRRSAGPSRCLTALNALREPRVLGVRTMQHMTTSTVPRWLWLVLLTTAVGLRSWPCSRRWTAGAPLVTLILGTTPRRSRP